MDFSFVQALPTWLWPVGYFHRIPWSSGYHWECLVIARNLVRWSMVLPPVLGTAQTPTPGKRRNQIFKLCCQSILTNIQSSSHFTSKTISMAKYYHLWYRLGASRNIHAFKPKLSLHTKTTESCGCVFSSNTEKITNVT